MKKIPQQLLKERMENLRQKVEKMIFCEETEKIMLTISVGIFNGLIMEEKQIENYENIINIADQALYEAKNKGRNRCILNNLDK